MYCVGLHGMVATRVATSQTDKESNIMIMKKKLVPLLFAALASLPLASQVYAQNEQPVVAVAEATTRININSADADTLVRELKGIGPSKAQAIVEYREQQGSFVSVDELLEVKGIGLATLERIRDQLTIE